MKYLRKQPRRRPDSAGPLRSAIAEYLGLDDQTDVSLAVVAGARPILSVTGFVCRSNEQELLDDVLRHVFVRLMLHVPATRARCSPR